MTDLKKTISGTFSDAFQTLPNLLIKAMTGGGGLKGALNALGGTITNSLFGAEGPLSKVTKGLGTALSGGLSKVMGSTIGSALGTGLSAILPGLGALVGPLIGKVGGFFKGLFGGMSAAEKETRKLRDAFIASGGGIDELSRKAKDAGVNLTAMLNAKTPEAYKKAIDDLNAAFEFQEKAIATLDEAVERWGFTIDELGPKFASLDIEKRAKSLYQDFKVLTAAGVSFDTIIGKMGKSFNDLVADARRTGAQVPAALRPILEQMVKTGELLDENGQAYGNLADAGLEFTETMTEGFNRMIAAVDKLVEAIERRFGPALARLPTSIDIPINVGPPSEGREPREFASGGFVTREGIQPIRWRPMGTDIVPAMLTPGELVLNRAQQAQLGAEVAGAGRTAPIILQEQFTFSVEVQAIDSRDMAEAVEKDILPRIITEIEDRRRGYAGRLARTLAFESAV
jgi:hypothetical protein